MLQVSALGCARDQRQLFADVSFSLLPGDLLQVLGANGSGKSTLLRILTGVYTDFEGEVTWDMSHPPVYLGHRPGVKAQLTVMENLRWMLAMRQVAYQETEVEGALFELALTGYEDTLCAQLSEGQRKRVALARFYLCDDPCWIMDEPFSAIDQTGLTSLKSALSRQVSRGGAVIFSTHQGINFDQPVKTLEL